MQRPFDRRRARRGMPWVALAGALISALACSAGGDGRRVRIVVVTLDTLRFDALEHDALERDGRSPMPRTRAFAARGERFVRFFAASSTTQPTHASLFTGLHPWQHGITRNGAVLGPEHRTLAEHLARQGFETAAVVASFPLEERFGFARGFDHYAHDFERSLGLGRWLGEPVEERRFYALADAVTERALEQLRGARGDRQFFWFHYFDPHDPYGDTGGAPIYLHTLLRQAREGGAGLAARLARARTLYEQDLAHLDASLGRLFEALDGDPEGFETHVVVTSDHGESFGGDGSMGHGRRVTPAQVHVPFFVVSPGRPSGVRRDVAGSVDLPATVCALAGVDPGGFAGRDLTAPVPAGGGSAFGMRNLFARAVADERTDGSVVEISGPRFFAVLGDGHYAGRKGAVERLGGGVPPSAELGARLDALFARFADALEGATANELLDAETQDALRALGYVR